MKGIAYYRDGSGLPSLDQQVDVVEEWVSDEGHKLVATFTEKGAGDVPPLERPKFRGAKERVFKDRRNRFIVTQNMEVYSQNPMKLFPLSVIINELHKERHQDPDDVHLFAVEDDMEFAIRRGEHDPEEEFQRMTDMTLDLVNKHVR